MSEMLSTDQIAALVEAAKEGTLDASPAAERPQRQRRVRPIDFTRPAKLSQDQERRIERAHDGYCRTAATHLSAEMRIPVELEVIAVDQHTWAASLAQVPQPSIFAIVRSRQTESDILLSIELSHARRFITRMLGGADPGKQSEEPLTEIEAAIARRLATTFVNGLSLTWQELLGLELDVRAVETQVSGVQLAPPSDPTLGITLELREQGQSSTMSILVPYRSIEPVIEALPSGQKNRGPVEQDPTVRAAVESSVATVDVELRAEVGSVDKRIDEIVALQEGDVVPLGVSASMGATLYADEVAIHRIQPGRHGSKRAIQILERLEAI